MSAKAATNTTMIHRGVLAASYSKDSLGSGTFGEILMIAPRWPWLMRLHRSLRLIIAERLGVVYDLWARAFLGQRASTVVVRPPRGVNSPRTVHQAG